MKKDKKVQCIILYKSRFKCKKEVINFIKKKGFKLLKSLKKPIRIEKDRYIIKQRDACRFKKPLKTVIKNKSFKIIEGYLK